ncbi:protein of unknown function [Aminobacter niigataensis]|nr:protein of unknown function [Aminobacter niigataensis]
MLMRPRDILFCRSRAAHSGAQATARRFYPIVIVCFSPKDRCPRAPSIAGPENSEGENMLSPAEMSAKPFHNLAKISNRQSLLVL